MTEPGNGQRILIIDDEVSLARNIKDYLEADGFDARVCWDGEAGIAAFDEMPAEVVVLDLTLPGMDGFAVLERLRTWVAATRVIIITAYGNGKTAVPRSTPAPTTILPSRWH